MKKRWYILCLGLIILGLLVRQPLLLILSVLGLVVLLTTDLWASYCLRDLRFQRTLSDHRILFGQPITLSLIVENAKILPLPWLEIEDTMPVAMTLQDHPLHLNLRTNRTVLENLFSPRWYERVTRQYTLTCRQRGVHTFGPTSLRSGDLFGFLERSQDLENKEFLIVYPLIVPLSSFNLPSRSPFGDRRAPRRLLEDPTRMVGVRDYVYGDDLRRVHWKATARAQKLQSKIYEPTTVYNLVIFLNSDSKLDAHYALHQEWQELAICAAASIANWGLDEGYAVGLYSNSIMYLPEYGMTTLPKTWDEQDSGEEEKPVEQTLLKYFSQKRVQIPPASHANQRRKIMEALARIQSSFGNRLEDLIEQERVGLPVGTTVVVITSSVSDPLLDALRHLKRAGHAVTLLLTGDQQIQFRLPDIPLHYLGGDETWQRLSAWYTVAEHAESQQTRQYAPVSAGLSL